MDFERENSGLESVSDNEAIANNGNLESGNDLSSKIENTGTLGDEHVRVEEVKDTEFANLMPAMVARSSDSGSSLVSPGSAVKGKGLRKWRRIRREATNEGNLNVDNSKLLKRGLSSAGVQPGKPTQISSEMRQMSKGSVSASNEVVQNSGVLLDNFAMMADSGLAMSPVFEAEGDFEFRDAKPVIAGHVNNRNRDKSSSGKISNSSVQKVQQGKTTGGRSKKLRGQVSIEKQNSHSSMESDSRSSNVVLMQDNNYVTSTGRQNGGFTNYTGESDQARRQGSNQFRTSYGSNNGREFEDVFQREMTAGLSQGVEEDNKEKQESSTDQDPLIESRHMLQSVQEALEKEVQNFKDIGNDDILVNGSIESEWTSVNSEVNDQSSSGEDDGHRSLQALESEISSLKENADLMKSNLEEITALLKVRETDFSELEDRLSMQAEVESIYRQKIEAEVNYLTISETIRDLRVVSMDKISVLEQQTASDKSQILNNLGYVESKAAELKRGAKELESYSKDVCPDETVKLQSNVCKYTFCFLIQLILFIVILEFLTSQQSPHTEVVPT